MVGEDFTKCMPCILCSKAVGADDISDTALFANVFNYHIYDGEQLIRPELLAERDPTEIALPYGADGAAVPKQKFRDAQKLYDIIMYGNAKYLLYGIKASDRNALLR